VYQQYLTNFDTRHLPQEEWEYVVVGSGIAGLYTAYTASKAGGKVVVTYQAHCTGQQYRQSTGRHCRSPWGCRFPGIAPSGYPGCRSGLM